MIIFLFLPFLLFAGVIENNISKVYQEAYPNIKIKNITIHNYKHQKINNINISNINTKRISGTLKVNDFYVFYKINAQIKVLKSTNPINKNSHIDYSNSKLTWIKFKNFYAYPMMKYSKKIAKMYIPQNRIIYKYMLKKKSLIRRNQSITIISQSGGIEVTFQATALQNGQAGDSIKVRKDNKTFFVTIDKNGNGRL